MTLAVKILDRALKGFYLEFFKKVQRIWDSSTDYGCIQGVVVYIVGFQMKELENYLRKQDGQL